MKRHGLTADRLLCGLLALASIGVPVVLAQEAEQVLSPIWNVTATTNGRPVDDERGPEYVVNGSGLDANNQHSAWLGDMWSAMENDGPVTIQFEFDRVYELEEMWVWNYNNDWSLEHGVKDATIETSENGEDWTVFGDIECAMGTGKDGYTANTIVPLEGILARHVRLTVLSTYGTFPCAGLSEVQFWTPAETTYRIRNVTATSNVPSEEGFGPENAVNDSGMNATGGHSKYWTDMWLVDPNDGLVSIQFEFDALYELENMSVWNCNAPGFKAKDVTIEHSEDGIDWTVFGDVQIPRSTDKPNCPVSTVVSLNGIAAQYVRLTIHNTWPDNVTFVGQGGVILDYERVGLSEVRFFTRQESARPPSYVLVLDDFEAYTDNDALNEAIFQTWIDDIAFGGNTQIGHLYTPFAELDTIHSGLQAMPFYYDNTRGPFYCETYRDFEGPLQNWQVDGAEALTLYFHGSEDKNHDTESDWLYVVVEDDLGETALVYYGDPEALLSDSWQVWTIDFAELAGVDLGRVKRLTLGVGDLNDPRPGADSIIYIDDIGLTGAVVETAAEN